MKPLFITFTNLREPYLSLAKNLGETIKRFDAGDFRHIKVYPLGDNRDFFTTSDCLVYSYIIKEINSRPLIILDCDNGLQRALPDIFEADWDIGACYRGPRRNHNGRQDYNGGLVALNNKRPDIIRKFWVEWINTGELWKKSDTRFWPETLEADGWRQSWYNKQSSLNQIIIPEDPDYRVVPGQSYVSHGYKIMPLKTELYGAKPGIEDAFIIHRKGGGKRK